eukprot:gene4030-8022_t
MNIDLLARESYIARQQEEYQRGVVNYKSCNTNTHAIYNWTYRNTGCDIISIITTTLPRRHGDMKDIKKYNKELKRIKGHENKLTGNVYRNPLQEEGDVDGSIARKRLHSMLQTEKVTFMSRLNRARNTRSMIENSAAIYIQKIFRGHFTRTHFHQIQHNVNTQREIRQNIIQILKENKENSSFTFSLIDHRNQYTKIRNMNAIKIQNIFRCYISRLCLRKKRTDKSSRKIINAIHMIQTWARAVIAKNKVRTMKDRIAAASRNFSSIRIQTAFRRMLARRYVRRRQHVIRWICGRMIQNWYRVVTSKRIVKVMRDVWSSRRKYVSAREFQRIIRGFIHRRRVDRIKIRYLYLELLRNHSLIQKVVRGFLDRRRHLQFQIKKDAITANNIQQQQHNVFNKGLLCIKKITAKGLKNVELLGGENDPYVKLSFRDRLGWNPRTDTIHGGGGSGNGSVTWECFDNNNSNGNEYNHSSSSWMLEMSTAEFIDDMLQVVVMDENKFLSDKLIGEGEISLAGVIRNVMNRNNDGDGNGYDNIFDDIDDDIPVTINIRDKSNKVTGTIVITLSIVKVKETSASQPTTATQTPSNNASQQQQQQQSSSAASAMQVQQQLLQQQDDSDDLAENTNNNTSATTLDEESLELLKEADIFIQAREGNTAAVGDIFNGLLTDEPQSVTDQDVNGDTVLTIAASTGNLELLRKCLMWGFDINHRNDGGDNALILSVRGGHEEILNYILNPPSLSDDEERSPNQILQSISNEDMGILFVSAAENGYTNIITTLDAQGFEVNSKHPDTGMTSMHMACVKSDITLLRHLFKLKASNSITDEMGQTPLHKACQSTIDIVKELLDLSLGTDVSMARRGKELLLKDGDGKDCLLLAALAGKTEIIKELKEMVAAKEEISTATTASIQDTDGTDAVPVTDIDGSEATYRDQDGEGVDVSAAVTTPVPETETETVIEIGWAPNDITSALHLSADGKTDCLLHILETGFDPSWAQEETSVTIAMVAALSNQIPVLDLLMNRSGGVHLDQVDAQGRSVLHYASLSPDGGRIISHILLHPKAAACRINEHSLAMRDKLGRSILYTGACSGGGIQFDLIASNGMHEALNLQDDMGMTPLMAAVKCMREMEVKYLLKLGADANIVDSNGKNALWHLFHRLDSAASGGKSGRSSHVITAPTINWIGGGGAGGGDVPTSLSKFYKAPFSQPSGELAKVLELELSKLLLERGCQLYSPATPIIPDPKIKEKSDDDAVNVAAKNKNVLFFKMLPQVVSTPVLWRTVLTCLDSEDEEGLCLMSLFEGEALVKLTMPCDDVSNIHLTTSHHPKLHPLYLLNGIFFKNINIAGWCIRLFNVMALKRFISLGIDPSLAVDEHNNNCLHLSACCGNVNAIDIIMTCGKYIKLEDVNKYNRTAVMEGARHGEMKTVMRLCKYGGNARKGLEGKYWAWLLALARKKEQNEKNLQIGLFGDDDEKYFSTKPDPSYITRTTDRLGSRTRTQAELS